MTKTSAIRFEKERETKNCIRFAEVSDVPAIGTLYLQKHAIRDMGIGDAFEIEIKPC